MPTLILSCSTGGGHNSAAKAIKEIYDLNNETCDIVEALDFCGKLISHTVCKGHVFLYRNLPHVFGRLYSSIEKHPDRLSQGSLIYKLLSIGSERLYKYITAGKYESVICTHTFAALMLTETIRLYNLKLNSALVITDYTSYPGVSDTELNYYFIPDQRLVNDFNDIPSDRLIACGIPISQRFYTKQEKHFAKKKMGISYTQRHILLLCGSMGCGPVAKLLKQLERQATRNCDISVICGTNSSLRHRLSKKYANKRNIHIRGYINDISVAMDSADICITKPGGISVTELLNKHIPMVLFDAVGGCEDYNCRWLVTNGFGISSDNLKSVAYKSLRLIQSEIDCERMKTAMFKNSGSNSARIIYSTMKEVYCETTCY